MRQQLRLVLTLAAASAALAACSDQPVSPTPVLPVARVNAALSLTCDFNATKAAVRDYVASGSAAINFLNDIIRVMSQSSDETVRYDQGMNGLAKLAEVRAIGPKKAGATPAQGATAVTAFLACMPVGEVQTDFANIVKAMGIGGMFEVPLENSTQVVYSRGKTPYWGTVPATGNWGDLMDKRIMVFGYEIEENIPGNSDPIVGGVGFNFNSVPMLAAGEDFNHDVLMGACGIAGAGTNARFKHVTSILADPGIDCGPGELPLASLSSSGALNFASLVARKAFDLFTPQPLSAATFFGGIGGTDGNYSPAAIVTVTVNLSFTSQPVDGPISLPLNGTDGISVKVLAQTGAGTPLEHALVTLEITGNSGLNAVFNDPNPPPPFAPSSTYKVTRETGPNGIADFAGVFLTKAGGYTLTATADFDGIFATPVVSAPANMQNK